MTMQEEAVARYHKLIASADYQDQAWIKTIQEKMAAKNLIPSGKPVCPVARPHFVTRRQLDAVVKSTELIYSAMDRVRRMAAASPAVMARLEMLPAEKMLASIDPGYTALSVSAMLDVQMHNGSFKVLQGVAEGQVSAPYADALSEIFHESQPMKELRKKYKIVKLNATKRLIHGVLTAYKGPGKKKFPRIAVVETRPPFKSTASPDNVLLAESFREAGYPAEVVTPEQLDYRGGVLSRGDFGIEIVVRRVTAQEFLVRFDLNHPLVRACREGAVCLVNSFRAEMIQKRTMLALLTDESVTESFPITERKAIRDHVPWTRAVAQTKTTHNGATIDLPEYIAANRESLILRPNDDNGDLHSFRGWETDASAWDRAIKTALRSPYVVQERVERVTSQFPVYQFGKLEMREMRVDLYPQIFLGKAEGCAALVSDATSSFSTLAGVAPVLVMEPA